MTSPSTNLNKKNPSPIFIYFFIILGSVFVVIAIIYDHMVSTFFGIAFFLSGSILYYITSERYVEISLFNIIINSYNTNIINNLIKIDEDNTIIYARTRENDYIKTKLYVGKNKSQNELKENIKNKMFNVNDWTVYDPMCYDLLGIFDDNLFELSTMDDIFENIKKVYIERYKIIKNMSIDYKEDNIIVNIVDPITYNFLNDDLKNMLYVDPIISSIPCLIISNLNMNLIVDSMFIDKKKKVISIKFKVT